jgi:hypothetical protein
MYVVNELHAKLSAPDGYCAAKQDEGRYVKVDEYGAVKAIWQIRHVLLFSPRSTGSTGRPDDVLGRSHVQRCRKCTIRKKCPSNSKIPHKGMH